MIEFCSYICEVVALTIFLRKKTDKLNKSHFRLFIIIVKTGKTRNASLVMLYFKIVKQERII